MSNDDSKEYHSSFTKEKLTPNQRFNKETAGQKELSVSRVRITQVETCPMTRLGHGRKAKSCTNPGISPTVHGR